MTLNPRYASLRRSVTLDSKDANWSVNMPVGQCLGGSNMLAGQAAGIGYVAFQNILNLSILALSLNLPFLLAAFRWLPRACLVMGSEVASRHLAAPLARSTVRRRCTLGTRDNTRPWCDGS